MLIQEILPLMDEAPFTQNASTATYDATQALVCQMDVVQADTGMDGEVIHSLFALFDERVAIDVPTKVFYFAVYLLQCLIDRNGTHGYRTVPEYPFACFVDVVSGG